MSKDRAPFKFKPRQRQALAAGSLRFLPEAQREVMLDDIEGHINEYGTWLAMPTSTPAGREKERASLQRAAKLAEELLRAISRDEFARASFLCLHPSVEAAEQSAQKLADFVERLRAWLAMLRTPRGGQESLESDLVFRLGICWRHHTGQSPSSGSRSRFMRLIEQLDDELNIARMPRALVRRALEGFDE